MYRKLEGTEEDEDIDSDWLDGLLMLLSGIYAASSRTMTSDSMSASLILNSGDIFAQLCRATPWSNGSRPSMGMM